MGSGIFQISSTQSASLPGSTGQSSTPGRWILDRPVEPGDDSGVCVTPNFGCAVRPTAFWFLRAIKIETVGWVERSETHHQPSTQSMMGFARASTHLDRCEPRHTPEVSGAARRGRTLRPADRGPG